jgi:RNA polymerase sigma-70 factor (ECF subfamily)
LSNANSPSENAKIDPDVALMLRVKEDDAMAFEMLIDRFQKKIIRFMNGWTRSAEQAEDLAQEVFLRVYKSRRNYLPTAKFSTWLYRIAHNVASNHLRDNAARREYQLSKAENTSTSGLVLENIDVAPSGYQPVRKLDHEERSKIILLALDALGERQRTAILLSKFEGMSYQEIGETMGLTLQAVKSLLMRARVNLKNLLDPYLQEGVVPGSQDSLQPESLSQNPHSAPSHRRTSPSHREDINLDQDAPIDDDAHDSDALDRDNASNELNQRNKDAKRKEEEV